MIPVRNSIGGLGNLMFKQAYLISQYFKGEILDVYVQDFRLWNEYASEIRLAFGEGVGYTDRVSLQIRRGDYITKKTTQIIETPDFYVNAWDTGFYHEAVKLFPTERFLVFCYDRQDPEQDKADRAWCEKHLNELIPGRWEFNEPTTETNDLNKMASCKHNIIANSTFGWWAAFLNPNPDKKVVVPKQWFSDGIERCTLPEEWIKI